MTWREARGVEMKIQIDANNLFGRWLTVLAATTHPSWEVDENGTCFRFLGGKGPRTPNGLDRWFLKTHPESAAELWELVNAEVRRAWRGKHLRLVK